jgi:hypothetical protein
MARGGYQQPSSPAPVSGPGSLSKRTDGQPVRSPGGMPYGENADFADLQSSAPMAATRSPQTQGQRAASQPGAPSITPLGAPTERPDEPLTMGNPMGPGAGPEVLSSLPPREQSLREAQSLKKYLPSLTRTANMDGVPPSFVRFVQYLRDI